MTIKEAIIEVDKERGHSENESRAAELFVKGLVPGAKEFLETELAPDDVEPFKNMIRKKFEFFDANRGEARTIAQKMRNDIARKN